MSDETKNRITASGRSYEIMGKLGEGFAGQVFLVKEDGRADPIALKFLNPEAFKAGQFESFKREFSYLSDLHNPHLCSVYDYGYSESHEKYFFTSEYIDGTQLYACTDSLTNHEIEEIFVQMADGIGAIHAAGLIHFDIKGANTLVTTRNGKRMAKIVDFGLALPAVDIPKKNIAGTIRYISPEMISKEVEIDYRADLYSLGIVLYRLIAKKYPEQGQSMQEVFQWHTHHESIDKEPLIANGAPEYLIDAIEKLTDPIPSKRFSSTAVLVKFIELHSGKNYITSQRKLITSFSEEGPLVGRDETMSKLRTAISHVKDEKAPSDVKNIFVIAGSRGIGKSRILKEAKYIAQLADVKVVTIRGRIEGSDLAKALSCLGLASDISTEKIAPSLKDRGAICIMVDDLDACENRVKDLILAISNDLYSQQMSKTPLPIIIFATMTVSQPEAKLPIEIHLGSDITIIERLNRDDIELYVRQILGEHSPPERLIDDIYSFSGGVPELMRIALASLDSPDAKLTASVDDIFRSTIEALSHPAREILALLAIANRPLEFSAIFKILTGHNEKELSELCATGLVSLNRGDSSYSISVGAATQATRSSIPTELKIEIARKLLDHTISEHPADIDSQVELSSICASSQECCDILMRAATEKENIGAIDTAYDYFQRAMGRMQNTDERLPALLRRLARHSILTGHLSEATHLIDEASKRTALTPEDMMSLCWIDKLKHNPASALRHAEQALLHPEVQSNDIEYLRIMNEKAECHLQAGEIDQAKKLYRETNEQEIILPLDLRRKVANNNLGLALACLKRFNEAIEFYRNKLGIFSNDKRLSSSILTRLGYIYQQSGSLDESYNSYRDAYQLMIETGDTHNCWVVLGNIINICQNRALYTDALHYAQEGLKLASKSSTEKNLGSNLLTIGALHIHLGLEDVANRYLKEALGIFRKIGDGAMEAWVSLSFAYLHRNLGNHLSALSILDGVFAKAKELKASDLERWAAHDAADICIDICNFERAREFLGKINVTWPGAEKARDLDLSLELVGCKIAILGDDSKDAMIGERVSLIASLAEKRELRELASEAHYLLGKFHGKTKNSQLAQKHITRAKEIIDEIASALSEEYRDSYLRQQSRAEISEDSMRISLEASTSPSPTSTTVNETADNVSDCTADISSCSYKNTSNRITPSMLGDKEFEIVGLTQQMLKVKNIADRIKNDPSTLLIIGETGSGKRHIARHICMNGIYRSKPFVSINMRDVPQELVLKQLSPTGDHSIFVEAGEGILYIERIEEMSAQTQEQLLSAVTTSDLKCRIISSSTDGLITSSRTFSSKLIKKLSAITITLPTLNERLEDIPLLIRHFLELAAKRYGSTEGFKMDPQAIRMLMRRHWKENIRELESIISGACAIEGNQTITPELIETQLSQI